MSNRGIVWQHRVVDYTYAELVAVQRASRLLRDILVKDRVALDERILRGGHDGEMMELHAKRVRVDMDVAVFDSVVRKQWDAIVNRGQPP